MKKLFSVPMVALLVLATACDKDNKPGKEVKYGIDGATPLPEAVDIGTVVDGKTVLWASFNLGASKEYEYGDYFAWGETEPHYSSLAPLAWKEGMEDGYDWTTYAWCHSGDRKLTKYCPKDKTAFWDGAGSEPDGMTTLLPADDVVRVKLGGTWRMPTENDISALLELKFSDDHTWETWVAATDAGGNERMDAQGNVIRGIRITRKSTGATLFLPAAGLCMGTEAGKDAGATGLYWTSSLRAAAPNFAVDLLFSGASAEFPNDYAGKNTYYRAHGLSVRPVSE